MESSFNSLDGVYLCVYFIFLFLFSFSRPADHLESGMSRSQRGICGSGRITKKGEERKDHREQEKEKKKKKKRKEKEKEEKKRKIKKQKKRKRRKKEEEWVNRKKRFCFLADSGRFTFLCFCLICCSAFLSDP